MTHIGFGGESFDAFRKVPRDGPIHMLNLVKLRDQAVYDDGREATGMEAYKAYSKESAPVFQGNGGRIIWSGKMEHMLIGPSDEQWHLCFVAEYPSVEAFVEMIKDPVYREAMTHRQAAVKTSRLIRCEPGKAGGGFG